MTSVNTTITLDSTVQHYSALWFSSTITVDVLSGCYLSWYPTSCFCDRTNVLFLLSFIEMDLYPSARFLQDAWCTKRSMDYRPAPWLNTNTLDRRVVRAYADRQCYLSQSIRSEFLSSYEEQSRCLLVTHSIGTHFSQSPGRRDAPRFCFTLGAGSWLLDYKVLLLSQVLVSLCPSSFDLRMYRTAAEATVGDNTLWLLEREETWHGIVDVHQDAVSWEKSCLR